jgi:hypothetical protein
MLPRMSWSLTILMTAITFQVGCAQSRMATRHTPSDYEVVLAVQASSRDSAAIETVSEVLDPDSPTGRSSEIRGGGMWNRIWADTSQHVLPRTDFRRPGASDLAPSQAFDSGF